MVPGGIVPPKPAAATPLAPVPSSPKSGTSVIKSAPPKETARITVKPSLPVGSRPASSTTPVAPGPVSTAAKAGVAAVAVAGATAAVKAGEAKPKAAVAVAKPAASTTTYQDTEPSGSSLLTTVAAGVLALVTWGTAALLGYYCFQS